MGRAGGEELRVELEHALVVLRAPHAPMAALKQWWEAALARHRVEELEGSLHAARLREGVDRGGVASGVGCTPRLAIAPKMASSSCGSFARWHAESTVLHDHVGLDAGSAHVLEERDRVAGRAGRA